MSEVTGPIETGDYYISSQNGLAFVALLDNNTGTPYTVTASADSVNKLNVKENGTFKIQAVKYFNLATIPQDPSPGTEVIAASTLQNWVIEETNYKGQYLIYLKPTPTSSPYYWALASTSPGTAVTVTDDKSKAESFKFFRYAAN